MMSDKAFILMVAFGMVTSHPFTVEPKNFRTSAEQRYFTDTFNEIDGVGTTIQNEVFKLSPKSFPKHITKFDSLKVSSYVSKPISTPAKESESTTIDNKISSPDAGLFRLPLYRQDLVPTSDQSRDSELKKVIIYSRDPYDVENFSSIPDNKDSVSFANTLKFIMEFLKQEAPENRSENSTSGTLNTEVSDPPKDFHSIYTPDGEFGQLRLNQKEEALLSSIIPPS